MQNNKNLPCTVLIKSKYNMMKKSEKKVADYILTRKDAWLNMTVLEAAAEMSVSEASVIRFCKLLGYSGYSELKLQVARESGNVREEGIADLNIDHGDTPDSIPDKVIMRTMQGLEDTRRVFDRAEYIKALRAIAGASVIDIYGMGGSYAVALDIEIKLIKLGKHCRTYSDSHLQIMSANTLDSGCVAVGVSHSGRTIETVDALRAAHKCGAVTVCLTNADDSPITQTSDIKLITACYETNFLSESMVSRILQLAVVDMLYLGLILLDYDKNIGKLNRINDSLLEKAY